MAHKPPIVSADVKGVWREDTPGCRFGIEWAEIFRVVGGKLDCVTDVLAYVELDFKYGESLELYDSWSGFAEVVHAISRNVPGISPDWFQQVASLEPTDQPVVVWERKQQ